MTRSEYTTAVNTLHTYDHQYFTLNAPTVSDEEYDKLYFQVQQYEQEHPEQILADSPTQYAHGEIKNGHRQVARRTPMLSTQKAQTVEAVEKWMKTTTKAVKKLTTDNANNANSHSMDKNVSGVSGVRSSNILFTVEWKYDGVSASLVYQDGKLIEASYGKGTEGNDCLSLIKQIPSVPQTITTMGRVEIRGEVVCPFANLDKTGYKNCRSAAAGIIADTVSTMGNLLEFYPWYCDADNIEGATREYRRQRGVLSFLACGTVKFLTAGYYDGTADKVLKEIDEFIEARSSLTIPVDGLVIKVDDCTKWERLGATAHHPKYSIAYKFAAATAETTITRIEITTGATGKRTPVAYYEPVVINGATYQKASVGSEAKLAEMDLHVGDRVIVSLRNDVIPHIDSKVESTTDSADNADSVTPNEEENVSEVSEVRSSNNTPVIAPENNHTPIYMSAEEIDAMIAGMNNAETELSDSSDNACYNGSEKSEKSVSKSHKVAAVVATVGVLAVIGVVAFAGLGAALFLTPLLAGALKA